MLAFQTRDTVCISALRERGTELPMLAARQHMQPLVELLFRTRLCMVRLEVSAVYTGCSPRAKELAATMPGAQPFSHRPISGAGLVLAIAGLDASCAVVDLTDGRRCSL